MHFLLLLQRCFRGFNLIEAAITLAVVGLVIGGIWVSAAAVQQNLQVANTVKGVLQASQHADRMLPRTMTTGTYYDITTNAIKMGFWPSDWVQGTSVLHPLGGTAYMAISAANNQYEIGLHGLNQAECLQILTKITAAAKDRTNLSFVVTVDTSSNSLSSSTWPVPPGTNLCPSNVELLDFVFNLQAR